MNRTTDYSTIYDPDTDFDAWYSIASARAIVEHLAPGDRMLELGCATGLMTTRFVQAGATVVGVDRSEPYLARARARHLEHATWVESDITSHLTEDPDRYDHVTLCNVLHEVSNPTEILALCRQRLRPAGMLHVTLQNPRSLHRLVALKTGLIDDLLAVSPRGEAYGTLRLILADQLVRLVEDVGLHLVESRGIMLKPYTNDQMALLPKAVLEGLIEAARHVPDHAALNYVLAHG